MKSIIVLGAGMVGRTIAADLAKVNTVTSVDVNEEALEAIRSRYGISTIKADVTVREKLAETISGCDLVVSAVPGFLGFNVLKNIIEEGRDVVDISFFPEDPLTLHELAVKKNVTAIVDAGVAPGIDNLVLGYYNARMKIKSFECLVGGLPKKPAPPYYYKAPFSPVDVIEEYIRPARFKINGKVVIKPALTDVQPVTFKETGKLVSFNTDGLRTILATMSHIPNLIEKTLRYPEHIKIILTLKEAGLFSSEKLTIGNQSISPLEFTAKHLIGYWKLRPGEKEFTVMRITVQGKEGKKNKKVVYYLYDEYDKKTGFSSMARTTGFACTASANLVLKGMFNKKGVFPLELVGGDEECFRFVFKYMEERGVTYRVR